MTAEKWVYEFSEGSRDMRDLLGGKGANVAEMTRVLGDDRCPAGVHGHHRGVRRLHARGPRARRPRGAGRRGAEAARGDGRQALRRRPGPAARVRPQRRARVDAGDARHDPQRRAQRHRGRGPGCAPPATSASRGTPTAAWCRCSATSPSGVPGGEVRGRDRRRPSARRASDRHRAVGATRCEALVEHFKGFYDFPGDAREQLARAIRAVFESWTGDRAV